MSPGLQRTDTPSAAGSLLPAALELGPVHLVVADLPRAASWYQRTLGLSERTRDGDQAELGVSRAAGEPKADPEPVVVLHEDRQARPPGRHAGLFHYALLYPSRRELALALLRLAAANASIQGASDHGTHEAIYLADADGNGIELAADRPRERWPDGLGYDRGPAPLDLDSLAQSAATEQPPRHPAPGLRVGHLHLHVGDVAQGIAFYRDVLGFELKADLGTAAFLSAGGYHHHLGINVWRGQGIGPPPPHTIGLRHWTIELPGSDDINDVRARLEKAGTPVEAFGDGLLVADPWGTSARLVSNRGTR